MRSINIRKALRAATALAFAAAAFAPSLARAGSGNEASVESAGMWSARAAASLYAPDAGTLGATAVYTTATPPVATAAPKLAGTKWMWADQVGADGKVQKVPSPDKYTLEFTADGRVAVKADCNSGGGPYTQDGYALTIGPLVTTLAACPPASLSDLFMRNLGSVRAFAKDGDALVLSPTADSGSMRMAPMPATPTTPAAPPATVAPPAAAPQPPPTSTTAAAPSLAGTRWQWTGFVGGDGKRITVTTPANYTLEFGPANRVFVKADCNNANGAYVQDGSSLTMGPFATTMALCAPESLSDQYLRYLGAVRTFVMDGPALVLNLMADAGNMKFAPAAAPAAPPAAPAATASAPPPTTTAPAATAPKLAGSRWMWVQFAGGDDSVVKVDDPAKYTLEFGSDGQAAMRVDCNRASAEYKQEGSSLTFGPIASTMAACPPGSLADEYLQDLGNVTSFVVKDGNLYLSLWADAGIMTFKPLAAPKAPARTGLEGQVWQWRSVTDNGVRTTIRAPRAYTLEFLPGGIVAVRADCNRMGGTYAIDGEQISIALGPSTMAMCPRGSLTGSFQRNLADAVSFRVSGRNLVMSLRFGDGSIAFTR